MKIMPKLTFDKLITALRWKQIETQEQRKISPEKGIFYDKNKLLTS